MNAAESTESADAARKRASPLARSFTALFGSQVIGLLIGVGYLTVMTRLLHPWQLGTLLFGSAFYLGLFVLASFGQGTLLGARLGRRPKAMTAAISHSLTLRAAATMATAAAGAAFIWMSAFEPIVKQVAAVYLGALIARSFAAWVRECFIGMEDVDWIPRFQLCFRGGEAALGTVLLLLGAGVLTLCSLHVLVWTAEAIAAGLRLRGRHERALRFGLRSPLLMRMLPASVVYTVCIGFLALFSQVGVVALKQLGAETSFIGQLGVAMQFFGALLIVPIAFGNALIPALSRVRRRNQLAEIASLSVVLKLVLLAGMLIAIIANGYVPWLLSVLLGEEYGPAAEIFAYLSWVLGPFATALIAGQALNALGARLLAGAMATLMVAMHVSVMAGLMPLGPMAAAAGSFMVASTAGCILGLVWLGPRIGIAGQMWWTRPLLLLVAAATAMALLPIAKAWSALAVAAAVVALIWQLGVLSAADLHAVLARLKVGRLRAANMTAESVRDLPL